MITITTPSILFPAISLLLLAYTNRFLALSQLIRSLHRDYKDHPGINTLEQIKHIRFRVFLVRLMQAMGVMSILMCTISILALIFDAQMIGLVFFILSLLLFLISIISSLIEILMSSRALNILLSDIEEEL